MSNLTAQAGGYFRTLVKLLKPVGHCVLAFIVIISLPGASAGDDGGGKVCFDGLVCEQECCSGFNMILPYCCSKNEGFMFLGLMVGGGVMVAIVVFACYVLMRRSERELQAAARLEEAKAANRISNINSTRSASNLNNSGGQGDGDEQPRHPAMVSNQPPPAYNEVMRNPARCHSCDLRTADIDSTSHVNGCQNCFDSRGERCGNGSFSSSTFRRQYSDGAVRFNEHHHNNNHSLYHPHDLPHRHQLCPLVHIDPTLVNINQLIAQHRLENFTRPSPELPVFPSQPPHSEAWSSQSTGHQMLPLPVSEEDQWNKLPTYEEYCTPPSRSREGVEDEDVRIDRSSKHEGESNSVQTITRLETSSLRRPVQVGNPPPDTTKSRITQHLLAPSEDIAASSGGDHSCGEFRGPPQENVCLRYADCESNPKPFIEQGHADGTEQSEPREDQDRVRHSLTKLPSIQESDEENQGDQDGLQLDTVDQAKEDHRRKRDQNTDHQRNVGQCKDLQRDLGQDTDLHGDCDQDNKKHVTSSDQHDKDYGSCSGEENSHVRDPDQIKEPATGKDMNIKEPATGKHQDKNIKESTTGKHKDRNDTSSFTVDSKASCSALDEGNTKCVCGLDQDKREQVSSTHPHNKDPVKYLDESDEDKIRGIDNDDIEDVTAADQSQLDPDNHDDDRSLNKETRDDIKRLDEENEDHVSSLSQDKDKARISHGNPQKASSQVDAADNILMIHTVVETCLADEMKISDSQ